MLILNGLIAFLATLLAIPVLWFCIQIAAACWRRNSSQPQATSYINSTDSLRIALLIPAHDESVNLIPTLRSVQQQGIKNLRVVVVADNCSDDTAEVARSEGAEVIERTNPLLRGKGYALDFGVQYLAKTLPQVVVILDADCVLSPKVIEPLSLLALTTKRPVQALYLMKNTGDVSVKSKIAEFAWLVKNHVRPLGLHNMGLPCQLTGSGMAFPWSALSAVPLATGEIVEDMKLGIALTALGYPPLFSERTLVISQFPTNQTGVKSQRIRWEHGHLAMIFKEGIPKLRTAFATRDVSLFFLALDLCIPPLALLIALTVIWQLLAGVFWAWSGNSLPFLAGSIYLIGIGCAVAMAWRKFGRHVISGRELLTAPGYIVSKLSVYVGFIFRRQVKWVRSKRDNEPK
ncbi:glycosyltransferase family 2 protein [Limnobacter parvus]|uniref:Glycosyltransferase family 2 protein n=1 Tax=Limnobacter parvus TaxID=2939690 RepID=A0ABT1XIK3_9BURK|nr:glycosyltransferase family 2 protein [Limnobacter parvus]MCR2745924.1 glycosyltransferase family 2 protein [Limnobacter parvus]